MSYKIDKFMPKGKKLSDNEKEAKISVISGMRTMASDMMKDSLEGVRASDNKDSGKPLRKSMEDTEDVKDEVDGQTSARELTRPYEKDGMEYQDDENSEAEEADDEFAGDMSEEDINKKLEKLMKLKDKLKK